MQSIGLFSSVASVYKMAYLDGLVKFKPESNTCHDSELQTQDMDKMSESQKEHREKEI